MKDRVALEIDGYWTVRGRVSSDGRGTLRLHATIAAPDMETAQNKALDHWKAKSDLVMKDGSVWPFELTEAYTVPMKVFLCTNDEELIDNGPRGRIVLNEKDTPDMKDSVITIEGYWAVSTVVPTTNGIGLWLSETVQAPDAQTAKQLVVSYWKELSEDPRSSDWSFDDIDEVEVHPYQVFLLMEEGNELSGRIEILENKDH